MDINWSAIKEILYTCGSIAGVAALLRPLAESKLQRDAARIDYIKSRVNEQRLVDLEPWVYSNRQIPSEFFQSFDQLAHERRTNQDGVRFTGPSAKALTRELDGLLSSYAKLREYVQVPWWEPNSYTFDGVTAETWKFNKSAFEDEERIPHDYAVHLDAAAEQAVQMLKAFQRFQLVSELHLFEIPFCRWLLPLRFRTAGL